MYIIDRYRNKKLPNELYGQSSNLFVVQEGRESHLYCLIVGKCAGPGMKGIINHSLTCLYVPDREERYKYSVTTVRDS